MVQQSIYASREGALYQSYDNYAGASGFYDPAQDMPPQQLMSSSATPMAAMPMQPAHHQQATFAQFYQEQGPAYQPVHHQQFAAPQYAHSATPMQQPQIQYYQPTATGAGTVQIMNVPQSMPQPAAAPSAAVPYGAQLRGVGIKFGERIDPRSGGMLVYVKRLVKGGPSDQANCIQPGDVLQLINGEDIYGQGLDILRDKIPGPAGTSVKLGFRSYAGQLYEVDLARTAYGDQPPDQPPAAPQSVGGQYMYAQQPAQQQPMQQTVMMTIAQPHQQYVAQVPQQTQQYVMAPRQQHVQYVQQPAVQYVQAPQYMPAQHAPQAIQYYAAPSQQVQYQSVAYQPQQQYQPLPPQPQYQQQQPTEQFLQPYPQAQQQYAPLQQYAPAQQQQQQQQYAPAPPQQQYAPQQYAPPQQQQQYVPAPPQQQQPQQQQQVYGDYQGGYGDYDDQLQGTQV